MCDSYVTQGELLVLLVEASPELSDGTSSSSSAPPPRLVAAADAARVAIAQEHGVALSHVRVLRARTVPKTTSGKIARRWCKRAFDASERFDRAATIRAPPAARDTATRDARRAIDTRRAINTRVV